ncbi:MAG: hypothetical protein K8R88_01115 [Armatimonadetes bacterium]|nr:hypothetical protein [Armatimonadota bacterium]
MLADAGRGWLSRKRSITIAAGTATGANFTLPNGDISNDGVIDLTDYTRLAVAFNAVPSSGNWDAEADVNGDDVVDLTDYTAVVVNFNGLDETP